MTTTRRVLIANGIVQGVGFRPFVKRLASSLPLSGTVQNTTRGVKIEIQGEPDALELFSTRLLAELPPSAAVLSLSSEEISAVDGEKCFNIVASGIDPVSSVIIPPDIALCQKCASEISDSADRRFGYPFANCTDCSPRYTIIEKIPYDRPNTSMAAFKMCEDCEKEYGDEENRRFHAQPNACPACGPKLSALDADFRQIEGDPLKKAAENLSKGGVVALLGIGGFHLACDAASQEAVDLLRERKKRPGKPFAVMARDAQAAKELATLSEEAALQELQSPAAPII
ncbi:carbamoyltransferase HypF, partial [bacterium]